MKNNTKKKKDYSKKLEDATDVALRVALVTVLLTTLLALIAPIVLTIASSATTETIVNEVYEVQVIDTQMSTHHVKGLGTQEDYYVTIKGKFGTEPCIVEVDKETFIACLEKEAITVHIVKTTDCFNIIKTEIKVV